MSRLKKVSAHAKRRITVFLSNFHPIAVTINVFETDSYSTCPFS